PSPAPTPPQISPLSLHDALPISAVVRVEKRYAHGLQFLTSYALSKLLTDADGYWPGGAAMDPYNRRLEKSIGQFESAYEVRNCRDRKSTRLNSSHVAISYAVFCL